MARPLGTAGPRKRGGAIGLTPETPGSRSPVPAESTFEVLTAPNPSPYTLSGTNTYVLGVSGPAVVIDPGPDDPAHVARVLERVASSGRRVGLILLTHDHSDHRGAVESLATATGATVRGWTTQAPLRDGEGIRLGAGSLQVLHTPGHAPDHVAFYWEHEGILFSGDLILGAGTVNVTPPAGSMADYLRSLERVKGLRMVLIAPGHGPLIHGPRQRITEYLEHRRHREQQVLELLAAEPRTVQALAATIYRDLDPRLRRAAEGTVAAHLAKLIDEGRVRRSGARFALA